MDKIQKNILKFLESLSVDDYSKASGILGEIVKDKVKRKICEGVKKAKPFGKDCCEDKPEKARKGGKVGNGGKGSAFEAKPKKGKKSKKGKKPKKEIVGESSSYGVINLYTGLRGEGLEAFINISDNLSSFSESVYPLINKAVKDANFEIELLLGLKEEIDLYITKQSSKQSSEQSSEQSLYVEKLNQLSSQLAELYNQNQIQSELDETDFDEGQPTL